MKRLTLTLCLIVATFAACWSPAGAAAAFGFQDLDAAFMEPDGSPATLAGSHPFAQTTTVAFNLRQDPKYSFEIPDGNVRDLTVSLPPGLVADAAAVPRCSTFDFVAIKCKPATQIGMNEVLVGDPNTLGTTSDVGVFNLVPPPGVVMRFGFVVLQVPVTLDVTLNPDPPYNGVVTLNDAPQVVPIWSSVVSIWGVPASPAHDGERIGCQKGCVLGAEKPFLTLPTSCTGPVATAFEGVSWDEPEAAPATGVVLSHDDADPPAPLGMTGCGKLGFNPTIGARPTSIAAQSPTGLDFDLNVDDEGLTNPKEEATAESQIRKAVVTLPPGFTTNPALAEGLNVCSEADLARETVDSASGAGCPNASKIGTVEVESPLVEESVDGAIYAATPYENPFGSLLALYMVIKNPNLGIMIKQPLEVRPDPVTGRLTTIADDLPQLPFSHFGLHFREGARSPLATPPTCGSYAVEATLYPWSGGAPLTTSSTFEIVSGRGGGACPSGGTPPFHPTLLGGTLNNAAGAYSPFSLSLTREDGEQEFTHFSFKLPPGLTGKLAGIPFCSDLAIAAAKARTGPHGGQEEIDNPSCPAASQIGRTLVGAGIGPSPAYAPGKIYLAGPYNGSALSIAAITAAKVGPFDLGTVVVREALKINPETAEVFIDATGSDPIPHIIQGIPVHARQIRAYVDRPDFTLNPTSCKRTSIASTVLGSGADFGSEADNQPLTVTTPFQAADCASLGFAPKLALNLKGGTKRNQNPQLTAVVTYPKGAYANIASAQVTLPRSAFLDNDHIKTVCTRVQFNEGAHPGEKCPSGSIYGYAQAITPLLSDPVEGPVFLRSNGGERELPDLVAALHNGQIDVNLVGWIDSGKGGGIRNTFRSVPDVPVSKFVLRMLGGKKGLLVNSTNLCVRKNRAVAAFIGQNGKRSTYRPVVKPRCKSGTRPRRSSR